MAIVSHLSTQARISSGLKLGGDKLVVECVIGCCFESDVGGVLLLGVLKAGEVLVPGTWLVIFSVRASLVLSSKLFRMSSRAIWRGRHPFLVSILFFHIFYFLAVPIRCHLSKMLIGGISFLIKKIIN